MASRIGDRTGLVAGLVAAAALVVAAACGGGEEATATPTTAAQPTPTQAQAQATPTTGGGPVVATPTPTATATPVPDMGEQPKQGGIARVSGSEDPPSFDSHTATSGAHNVHNALLNTNLVWRPNGDLLVPDAAESWEISADGMVWTFKLRPNVMFQTGYEPAHPRDGTAMTAQDVKWSLEKIMGLHNQLLSARSGWMKEFIDIDRPDSGLEVVDNLTLNIHLIQPFAGLADVLAIGFSGIYPDGVTRELLQIRPYGAGPFKLVDFQRGSLWKYGRNPDYFKPGLPYLDEFHHINIKGTEVVQQAFLTNKTDIGGGYPTRDNEPLYQAKRDSGEIYSLDYNTTCRPTGVNMNSTRPPFDDLRLRQAVNLAIDRVAYTTVVHDGHASPHFFLDTGGWGRSEAEILAFPGYATDPAAKEAEREEARAILQELHPGGLDVTMLTRDSSSYMRQGEFIAGELSKVGFNVSIQILNSAQLFPQAQNLDYEIWNYWFCQTTEIPEELFGSYFVTGGSRNWLGYSNPKLDAGFLDMAGTSDPAERRQKAIALEDIVLADLPIAPVPVSTSQRHAYSYLRDLPVTKGQSYMWSKNELIWRSDV